MDPSFLTRKWYPAPAQPLFKCQRWISSAVHLLASAWCRMILFVVDLLVMLFVNLRFVSMMFIVIFFLCDVAHIHIWRTITRPPNSYLPSYLY